MSNADQEPIRLPKNIAIFITDQGHECQRDRLPEGAVPGFGVTVYRLKGHRPTTRLEAHWSATRDQAEQAAQEYVRQYCTMAECGWR